MSQLPPHSVHPGRLIVCHLFCFMQVFGPDLREQFPCVTRYFVTLAHQQQFKAIVGDVTLAAEEQKYVRACLASSQPDPASIPSRSSACWLRYCA